MKMKKKIKKEVSFDECWQKVLLERKDCNTCRFYKDSTYFGYLCQIKPTYKRDPDSLEVFCHDYVQEGTLGI